MGLDKGVCGAELRSLDRLKGNGRSPTTVRLDGLDLRMLKLLLAGNGVPPGVPADRRSFRSMAKDLGVDQATVRSRMKRLQEAGTLRGWYLGISPALTGESVVHTWLDVKPGTDRRRLVDELVSVPGVERVCSYLGQRISLVLLFRKEKDLGLTLRRLERLAGSGRGFRAPGAPQGRSPKISESDAAIILCLLEDPWKPYAVVAKELRFSSRTVKRRADRLFESGAIYVVPDLDLKTLRGIIAAEMVVTFKSDSSKTGAIGALATRLQGETVFSQTSGLRAYFALAIPNVSMVEAIGTWARQLVGVFSAEVQVLQEVDLAPGRYRSTRLLVGREEGRQSTSRRVPVKRPGV